jgi:hypothetical protein
MYIYRVVREVVTVVVAEATVAKVVVMEVCFTLSNHTF